MFCVTGPLLMLFRRNVPIPIAQFLTRKLATFAFEFIGVFFVSNGFHFCFHSELYWKQKKTPKDERKMSWSQKNRYNFGILSITTQQHWSRIFRKLFPPTFSFWTFIHFQKCPISFFLEELFLKFDSLRFLRKCIDF